MLGIQVSPKSPISNMENSSHLEGSRALVSSRHVDPL